MDRLCDEVVQLIFYELTDPTSLTLVSTRFYRFSQDPYVRAHYFLARYGPTQAMYHALGRGKIITERVLDILLTSGAHLSRYLVQVAMHHYFYTQAHFIKTPWVRIVPLHVFIYFLKLAQEKYGEIPRGKGDDDGSLFSTFLKESRYPPPLKVINWESIREILEKYNFIPFCNKDPIMAQFPLALSIEPRLLPHAVANGFHMDCKYRDFVFRKMFERAAVSSENRADDIVHNVRELCRLDETMFVSRTVAAEVCMEAKINDPGYSALRQLDKSGHLRFELFTLVEDLLKTFVDTRSIANNSTMEILRHLYADFPSTDPTVRLVMLLTVFISSETTHASPTAVHAKLEALGLTPISRRDVFNVLVNPFMERFIGLLDYARKEVVKEDGTKGLESKEIRELVEDVGMKCLEVACKGKLLKKLHDGFSSLNNLLMTRILTKHQIKLEDLPAWDVDWKACQKYEARLSRDFSRFGADPGMGDLTGRTDEVEDIDDEDLQQTERGPGRAGGDVVMASASGGRSGTKAGRASEGERVRVGREGGNVAVNDLGIVTQESLTTMIRHDEITPARSRRRMYYPYSAYGDSSGKLRYPHEPLAVAKWAKSVFEPRSSIIAIFMTHAVINDHSALLQHYLNYVDASQPSTTAHRVPVTFKHFQILARLGRAPNFYVYHDIEVGAEFYFDEDDYIAKTDSGKKLMKVKVKSEASQGSMSPSSGSRVKPEASASTYSHLLKGKKRPRRSAASVRSYAVPDSDYEDDNEHMFEERKQRNPESSLQRWLKHLGELMKEETRKFKEKKKQMEMAAEPGTKVRLAKTEFLKSISSQLRHLRKIEEEKRLKLYGTDLPVDDYTDDSDDEYKSTRAKRRRSTRVL